MFFTTFISHWMPLAQGISFSAFFILLLLFVIFRFRNYLVMTLYAATVLFESGVLFAALFHLDLTFLVFFLVKYGLFLVTLMVMKKMFSSNQRPFWGFLAACMALMSLNVIGVLFFAMDTLLFVVCTALLTLMPLLLYGRYMLVHRAAYAEMPGSRISSTRVFEKGALLVAVFILALTLNIDSLCKVLNPELRPWSGILFSLSALLFLVGAISRLDALKVSSEVASLQKMAYWDDLTGAMNRHASVIYLERYIQNEKREMALLFLDMKNFKHINDTYGHQQGDIVLRKISMGISSLLADADLLFRLGGDEFLLLLMDYRSREQVLDFLGKVDRLLTIPFTVKGVDIAIELRSGIVFVPAHGHTREELLQNVDEALICARKTNRPYYFYSEDVSESSSQASE